MSIHNSLAEAELRILCENLTDFERTRIAAENRLRALRQVYGITEDHDTPEVRRLAATVKGLAELEHTAELDVGRAMRAHPLGPWVKATPGIGTKQGARLIAAIGDPYWNDLHDRPRTVSELWAYCGYHVLRPGHIVVGTHDSDAGSDPSSNPGQPTGDAHSVAAGVAPSRKKGQKANWNTEAKMRAFLCAEAAVKAGVRKLEHCDDTDGYDLDGRKAITDLGQTYLDGRAKYAKSTHPADCRRCGPKGKPVPAGSDLSDGHKHARSLRLVSKEVLRLMWLAARDAHD